MELRELVQKYLEKSGEYGRSIPLASLGFSKEEIENAFGTFDEDYHISRFIHLARAAGAHFQINGFSQTHVSIDAGIQSIL